MISCSNVAVYRVGKTMKTDEKQTPPSPLEGVADAQGGLKKIPAKSGKPTSSGKTEVVAIEGLDSEIASMRQGCVDAIVLVESRLTPMGEKIRDLQAELLELFDRKNRDYGTGNIATFGELGVLVRCSDKVARLKNMLGSGGEPNFESMEDSWRDLAVHAMIGLLCHRGEWK